jgi:RNA polymerase sigma-70 factor (ECF subfamily)
MRNPKKEFGKIYDKHVAKIYRFVYLKVDSRESAEDLTSQIFTKLWEKIKTLSGRTDNPGRTSEKIENPTAYVYQIARAEIANYYRNKPKYHIIPAEEVQIVDPKENLEEKQQLQSDIEYLKYCLSQLSEDHQNVIIWRYLDDLSYKEIAEIMQKEEGAVRVMVHRAIKELREKMGNGDREV